jgi:NitT/TauT family transport system ATP-binding protein
MSGIDVPPGATTSAPAGSAKDVGVKKSRPVVQAENVTVAFGREGDPQRVIALQNASLTVQKGELVSLIGPSGCGKSSLLNIIGGLAKATTGSVLVDGEPVTGPSPQKIAYVFQESTLYPWKNVFENVKLGMAFQGVARSERDDRAAEALKTVGLTSFAQHLPSQLSGGMKQRVQLARALSLETDIILMDEPFAALDEQTRMVLGEELSILLAKTGKTIIFVTHSLVEAVFLADRIAVFSARPGRIMTEIVVEEEHPRRPEFMMAPKLHSLRDELYGLLREEIKKTIGIGH